MFIVCIFFTNIIVWYTVIRETLISMKQYLIEYFDIINRKNIHTYLTSIIYQSLVLTHNALLIFSLSFKTYKSSQRISNSSYQLLESWINFEGFSIDAVISANRVFQRSREIWIVDKYLTVHWNSSTEGCWEFMKINSLLWSGTRHFEKLPTAYFHERLTKLI